LARILEPEEDALIRLTAFEHVRRLSRLHPHLTANELKPGFLYDGERIPLINPQRGIFKPQRMRFLLSIKTVFPRPGGRVWYDDQRDVHRQIFEAQESVEYAFMGKDPDAADNRWLRDACEHRIPLIYFLGIAPSRYQAIVPTFVTDWDAKSLRARVSFGLLEESSIALPDTVHGTPVRLTRRQAEVTPDMLPRGGHHGVQRALRSFWTA
jgi:putative restriction endonuclease